MNPIFTEETIISVDSSDLDTFIAATYGLDSFQGTLESPNDSTHEFTVNSMPDAMWEFDKETAKQALADGNTEVYNLGTLLQKLQFDGHVKPGKYLVSVSW